MANRFVVTGSSPELRDQIAAIQREQGLAADFPPEVEETARAAAAAPRLPDLDRTDLPFVTVDPKGSEDLDQALHLERAGDGYTVHYAIADVAAFVAPGDPVDLEANRRGETLYGADTKLPLHPVTLSEGAASLLPDQVRPAFVWTLDLDAQGNLTRADVRRARVRSTAQLSYAELDGGSHPDVLALLKEVGELRVAREADRGGVNLALPEQEVAIDGDTWSLEFRSMLPVESWNAQLSLLTGFAAGAMMVEHGIGLLRTLPPPPEGAVRRLRRRARALQVAWPEDEHYAAFARRLDSTEPHEAAMIVACTSLLRGAAYAGFDGEVPALHEHAALAAVYAHCTAPLRRLVDRYALEICASLCAGEPVPDWVKAHLADVPKTMQEADHRAHAYENAVLNLVEAEVLRNRVGETFTAVVLEADEKDPRKADIQLRDPAVEATVTGTTPPPVGEEIMVTLASVDVPGRAVHFTWEEK